MNRGYRLLSSLADISSYLKPTAYRVLAIMTDVSRESFLAWPTITGGASAPDEAQPNGSVYFRTDGGAGSTVYIRVSGAWLAIGSGSDSYRIISTFPATIGIGDVAIEVTVSGTLALPTPTSGRKLHFRTRSGADLTLTRASSGVEGADMVLVSSTVFPANEGVTFRGIGSVWLRYP